MQVEAEIVARGEIAEPVIADADPATLHFVDHGIHHRMRRTKAVEVSPPLLLSQRPHGRGDVVTVRRDRAAYSA
ncbi:MAG: hypothetical protein ACLP9C_14700 [Acidimicrobiales bacterium]